MADVDICNQALAHLGDRDITALDASAAAIDPLAAFCLEFYPAARQEALAAHRWTFAKKTAELVEDDTVITFGFSYAHTLPSDRLRFMRIVPGSEVFDTDGVTVLDVTYSDTKVDKFKIVGGDIWTNHKHVAAEYIRDMPLTDDPDLWTPHFRAAVARLLASKLAGPVTNEDSLADKHMRIYETVDLPNAQFYDAVQDNSNENSNHEGRLATSKFLQARYAARYGGTEPNDLY